MLEKRIMQNGKRILAGAITLGSLYLNGCTEKLPTQPSEMFQPNRQILQTVNIPASEDSFVLSQNPTGSYGNGEEDCPACGYVLRLSPDSGHVGESRILLKYPLNSLPEKSRIREIILNLKDLGGATNNSSDCVDFEVRQIISPWSESDVNWNNQPEYGCKLGCGKICGEDFELNVPLNFENPEDGNEDEEKRINEYGIALIPLGAGSYGANYKTMPSKELDGVGASLSVIYKEHN